MQVLASIPSPTQSVWHLGPFPIRAYALCIIAGILVAVSLTTRRWVARGGKSEHVWDIAAWAIVLGIIGGRLYHVVSDPELYFEAGEHPINALKIWDGGLGIWGAIALGTLGAWIGCRRRGIDLRVFADAAVPGVIFAQAIGRVGNWFNNELYGASTSLPWGLKVHCLDVETGHSTAFGTADGGQICNGSALVHGAFQPTFLYELIWDVLIGIALILIDRRLRLGRGNVMALYVMGYTAGRAWIEMLRTDHANHILGVRLNVWTAVIVFVLGLVYFLIHDGFHAAREATPYYAERDAEPGADAGSEPGAEPAPGPAATAGNEVPDDASDGSPPGTGDQPEEVAADVGPDD